MAPSEQLALNVLLKDTMLVILNCDPSLFCNWMWTSNLYITITRNQEWCNIETDLLIPLANSVLTPPLYFFHKIDQILLV